MATYTFEIHSASFHEGQVFFKLTVVFISVSDLKKEV